MPRRGSTGGRHQRPDPYERAVDEQLTTDAPPPRTMRPLKVLGIFAVGAVAFALGQNGLPGDGPAIDGGCDRPAFVLSDKEVRQYGSVRWSVTGPRGTTLVIAVDATAPPEPGPQRLVTTTLDSCQVHGAFGVPTGSGDHTVTAFLLSPDGTSRTAGTVPLSVVAP